MEVAKESDQSHQIARAVHLLRCIRAPTATHRIEVKGLGVFTLHILVEEGLAREVHVIRNGIYITSKFDKFDRQLRKFPATREFIAALEPSLGEEGRLASSNLKRLENPSHDALEPERIRDPETQVHLRRQMNSLFGKVRDAIKQTAMLSESSRTQLDELSHLFADRGGTDGGSSKEGELDPEHFNAATPNTKSNFTEGGLGEGTGGSQRGGENSGGPGSTRTRVLPAKGSPAGSRPAAPLRNVRSMIPLDADQTQREIHFTASRSGEISLAIKAVGLSTDVELPILESSLGLVHNNRIRLAVKDGERSSLIVTLKDSYDGPIDLASMTIKVNGQEGTDENI
jgi:hypothetical protein